MFDILKGTEHVLIAPVSETDTAPALADLSRWTQQLPARLQTRLRVVAITQEIATDQPNIALYHDRDGAFAKAYGTRSTSFLVRPDGYIGWRGASWRDDGLAAFISRTFQA
jgi:FAD/FMN-containing dehydrogenase